MFPIGLSTPQRARASQARHLRQIVPLPVPGPSLLARLQAADNPGNPFLDNPPARRRPPGPPYTLVKYKYEGDDLDKELRVLAKRAELHDGVSRYRSFTIILPLLSYR